MMINKITPSLDNNYWMESLYTILYQDLIRVPKVLKSTNVYKTSGTSIIYSPMYNIKHKTDMST